MIRHIQSQKYYSYHILIFQKIISRHMQVVTTAIVQQAIANKLQNQSCTDFHPGISCNRKAWSQFVTGSQSVFKMYLAVHLVPLLLFKRKNLKEHPARELLKLIINFTKSILFAGGYTSLVRRTVCFISQHYRFVGFSNGIAAIVASMSLLCEPVSRQSQIALYTLNKSMEVCYLMAKRRGWPVKVPFGEGILLSLALAIICYHYMTTPQAIRGSYLAVLNKILGDI